MNESDFRQQCNNLKISFHILQGNHQDLDLSEVTKYSKISRKIFPSLRNHYFKVHS